MILDAGSQLTDGWFIVCLSEVFSVCFGRSGQEVVVFWPSTFGLWRYFITRDWLSFVACSDLCQRPLHWEYG